MRNPQDFKNNYISLDGNEDLINILYTESRLRKPFRCKMGQLFMEKERRFGGHNQELW